MRALSEVDIPLSTDSLKWGFIISESRFSRLLNLSLSYEDGECAKASAFMPIIPFATNDGISSDVYMQKFLNYANLDDTGDLESITITATLYQPLVSVQCNVNEWHSFPGND